MAKDYSKYKVDPLPDAAAPVEAAPAVPGKDYSKYKIDPVDQAAAEPASEDWGTLALSALGEGAAEAVGFAGDIIPTAGNALGRLGRRIIGKPQLTEEEEANLPDPLGVRKVASTAQKYVGSEALKGYEKDIGGFDEFYQPRTTLGKYGYEGIKLLPSAVAGPASLGRAALKEGFKVAAKEAGKNALRYAAVPAIAGTGAEQLADNIPQLKPYAPWVKAGVEAATSLGSGIHAKAPVRRVDPLPTPPPIKMAPLGQRPMAALTDKRAMVQRAKAATPAVAAQAEQAAKSSIVQSAIERAKNSGDWRKNRGAAVADAFRGIADDPAQMARFTDAEQKQILRIVRSSTTLTAMQNLGRFSHYIGPLAGAILEGGVHAITSGIPGAGALLWAGMEGARAGAKVIPRRKVDILSDMVRTGKGPMKTFPGILPSVGQAASRVMYPDDDYERP